MSGQMSVEASVEATRRMISEMRSLHSIEKFVETKDEKDSAFNNGNGNSHSAAAINGGRAEVAAQLHSDALKSLSSSTATAVRPLGAAPSSDYSGAIVPVFNNGNDDPSSMPPKHSNRDSLMPMIPGTEAAKRAESATEWLLTLRLEKYCEAFETLGVRKVYDFVEVGEADLTDAPFSMPMLHKRRFLTAAGIQLSTGPLFSSTHSTQALFVQFCGMSCVQSQCQGRLRLRAEKWGTSVRPVIISHNK